MLLAVRALATAATLLCREYVDFFSLKKKKKSETKLSLSWELSMVLISEQLGCRSSCAKL